MPRLLAFETDSREARIVVARTRGKQVVIENAIAVELSPRGEASGDSEVIVNSEKLAQAITSLGVGRLPALVAVGRSNIELRQLTVPPAPVEELPELARFQALRQFSNIGEDWPLDFVALPSAEGESTNILAAVIAPQVVKQIKERCIAANLTADHLVLRPFAAAALLRREAPDTCCRMMVDVAADEADLTILTNDQVVFMRTVRLPHEADLEAQHRALTGEIRRTIVAAQNQLGGKRVEKIVICSDGGEGSSLKTTLSEAAALPVVLLNPFQYQQVEFDSNLTLPKFGGRFTSLIGMLVVAADGQSHDIDFLHPKRRPTAPSRRRQYSLIAATVGSLIVAGGFYLSTQLSDLDDKISSARSELAALTKKEKDANARISEVELIEKFVARDVSVLDELSKICKTLPPPEKAVVTRLTYFVEQVEKKQERGKISMTGNVSESALVKQFEDSLRDKDHRLMGSKTSTDPKQSKLPWTFTEDIVLQDPLAAKAGSTRIQGTSVKKSAAKSE